MGKLSRPKAGRKGTWSTHWFFNKPWNDVKLLSRTLFSLLIGFHGVVGDISDDVMLGRGGGK